MKNRTKYQQFLEAEKSLGEKGYAVVGESVLIRKDIWDASMEFTRQARVKFQEKEALMKQVGRPN